MKRHNRFVDWWTKMLWDAMARTGHGYRYPAMTRDHNDRRKDKLEVVGRNKHLRGYNARYT